MKRPWGSQFFAALSPNSRHAIFTSVGWQIEYQNKDEPLMGIDRYPEKFNLPKLESDIYAPIKNS